MKTPNKVRFYYNGKRRKDIYPEYSAAYVLMYKIRNFFKKWSLLIIGIIILTGGVYLHQAEAKSQYCDLIVVSCK